MGLHTYKDIALLITQLKKESAVNALSTDNKNMLQNNKKNYSIKIFFLLWQCHMNMTYQIRKDIKQVFMIHVFIPWNTLTLEVLSEMRSNQQV